MMCAYDKVYLSKAQISLGRMADYAVYDLGYGIDAFFQMFILSGYADRFGRGDCALLVGKSGIELARMVVEDVTGKYVAGEPKYASNRSPEYWAGWALAYFQWLTSISFREIVNTIPVSGIVNLYLPYHEMDIRQFCDKMKELYKERNLETNLKRLRQAANLTQKELAEQSEIPLRTIQQYEQRRKDINKAQAEYIILLSRVLNCEPEDLLEKV